MANYFDGSSTYINSNIYRWSSTDNKFEVYQNIATMGALNITYFTIEEKHYFVIANSTANCRIYKWDIITDTFIFHHELETSGTWSCDFMTIDGIKYLAVANSIGTTSTIFEWNYNEEKFVHILLLQMKGSNLHHLKIYTHLPRLF